MLREEEGENNSKKPQQGKPDYSHLKGATDLGGSRDFTRKNCNPDPRASSPSGAPLPRTRPARSRSRPSGPGSPRSRQHECASSKRLKAEVEKQSKTLEKKKETITESAGRQQKKKIERQEEKLKNNNRDLSMVRMKSMFAIGFCFTALMGMFNSIFDGRVVAKLPFTPLTYIQGLSHRNLLGDDTTDCSFIFLYILCTMSIRQNIQKILGLAPSRAATKQAGGFLGPPPPSGKFS
ncbi:calcium load-activated calcium channel [Pteropus vampyrus]|uniref:Calcium load-activated calcium channel n=1 Tax=Pteropus vampyrus TaxID=132908 RepID=A0A6P6BKU7_PTEVA|nr:calcium load-activated calcium channel [Pteropus vampyrus]